MISTLFSSLNTKKSAQQKNAEQSPVEQHQQLQQHQPQPILFILEKTMPIFKQVCDLFINDTQVVEVSCRTCNYMWKFCSILSFCYRPSAMRFNTL
jgi:hypothetical protein